MQCRSRCATIHPVVRFLVQVSQEFRPLRRPAERGDCGASGELRDRPRAAHAWSVSIRWRRCGRRSTSLGAASVVLIVDSVVADRRLPRPRGRCTRIDASCRCTSRHRASPPSRASTLPPALVRASPGAVGGRHRRGIGARHRQAGRHGRRRRHAASSRTCCVRTPLPGRRPIVAIPTTSGTGAEVTRTCIVSDRAGRKMWTWGDEMLPDLVVLDPTAAATMPHAVTVGTGSGRLRPRARGVLGRAAQLGRVGVRPTCARSRRRTTCLARRADRHRPERAPGDAGGRVPGRHRDRQLRYRRRPLHRSRAGHAVPRPPRRVRRRRPARRARLERRRAAPDAFDDAAAALGCTVERRARHADHALPADRHAGRASTRSHGPAFDVDAVADDDGGTREPADAAQQRSRRRRRGADDAGRPHRRRVARTGAAVSERDRRHRHHPSPAAARSAVPRVVGSAAAHQVPGHHRAGPRLATAARASGRATSCTASPTTPATSSARIRSICAQHAARAGQHRVPCRPSVAARPRAVGPGRQDPRPTRVAHAGRHVAAAQAVRVERAFTARCRRWSRPRGA